ncbi:MAG: CAP domain-containing protein [Methanophagales archaeon ANME-1-THS]|nr:MAG: CAP domain-containing protein [Methanophagales archaeon ANME-1-THS]
MGLAEREYRGRGYGYSGSLHVQRRSPLAKGVKRIAIPLVIAFLAWQAYQIQHDRGLSDSLALDHYLDLSSITEPPTARSPQTAEVGSEELEKCEKLIFDLTNAERRASGLAELIYDPDLAKVAREHSLDMVENDFFSHTNLRGEDPTGRARRHGLEVVKSRAGGVYIVGIAENIGLMPKGNLIALGYAPNEPEGLATAQVQSWLNSSKHRANILNPRFEQLGVGVAYNGHYFVSTQNFQ